MPEYGFSLTRIFSILSLYSNMRVRENSCSGIFYAVESQKTEKKLFNAVLYNNYITTLFFIMTEYISFSQAAVLRCSTK